MSAIEVVENLRRLRRGGHGSSRKDYPDDSAAVRICRTNKQIPGGQMAIQDTRLERINLKRAYDPVASTDGTRFLVERLWPRGVKKTALHPVDHALKRAKPYE